MQNLGFEWDILLTFVKSDSTSDISREDWYDYQLYTISIAHYNSTMLLIRLFCKLYRYLIFKDSCFLLILMNHHFNGSSL